MRNTLPRPHSPIPPHTPRALWVLLAVYLALALAYNFVFPPFEPTDEMAHYGYVRYLIEARRFPVAQPVGRSEYHQPPLYYAIAAVLAWPFPADDLAGYADHVNPYRAFRYWEPGLDNKNLFLHGPWDFWPFRDVALSVHVARLASLGLGAITVLLTYQVARTVLDERASLAAASLAGLLPMFLAVSGSLQNDAGAAAAGAVVIWLGLSFYRSGFTARRALGLGLALGVGALMKITVVFLLVPALLLIVIWGRERSQPLSRVIGYLGVMMAASALSGGWWYVRNQALYGEPTAVEVNLQAHGGRSVAEGMAVWRQALPYAWSTFWGRFGHGDVVLPDWIYVALGALSLLGLLGVARGFLRLDQAARHTVAFLGLAGLAEFASLMGYLTLSPSGYMGRYTFPALPAYMTLMVFGLLGLTPERARRYVPLALPIAMFIFAVMTLGVVLVPVYTPPPAISGLPPGATRLDATLGDVALLEGYAVSADEAQAGDRVYVTLYWQPLRRTDLPYSVFIHLFDDDGTLVTQRDTYPGLGRNATTAWTPGQMFGDRYLIVIPETTFTPTVGRWTAGLWQADTGERAFVLDSAGQPVASGVSFGELALNPRPGSAPNAAELDFGGAVRLAGYTLPTRVLIPGRPFDLTVYWGQEKELSRPYFFFAHVRAPDGRLWANSSFEVNGAQQTVQPVLAADTPPGLYDLVVGVFYDAGSGQERLKILAEDGHEIDDQVRLTGVRVVQP